MIRASRRDWLKAAFAMAAMPLACRPRSASASTGGRLPTIDDYLKMKEIGVVRPSPNGRWLAVEVYRGRLELAQRAQDLGGFYRSDIWLVDRMTGDARELTRGAADGSAYWAPTWSPTGDHIAVLTNQGNWGDRPALIDPRSSTIRVLGAQAVATSVNFGSSGRPHIAWCIWRTPSELLTVLLGDDDSNLMELVADPDRYYTGVWAKARSGALAVTTWDSRHPKVCGELSRLVAFDAGVAGRARTLKRGAIRSVSLSRTGRYAALIVATNPVQPSPSAPLEPQLLYNAYNIDMRVETELLVLDLMEGRALGVAPGVAALTFHDVRRHPQWGPGDQTIVVPSFTAERQDRVYRIRVPSLEVDVCSARSPLDAELITMLLARRPANRPIEESVAKDRIDLSRQGADDTPLMLVPGAVMSLSGDDVVVHTNGQLVSVDPEGRPLESFSVGDAALLRAPTAMHPTGRAIFGSTETFVVERSGGRLRRRTLEPPQSFALPIASIESSPTVLWVDDDFPSTHLLSSDLDNGRSVDVLKLNPYLEEIWRPEVRRFDYTLPNGKRAIAAVLLPPGYSAGAAYPLVIHGYPSVTVTASNLRKANRLRINTVHRLLLSAHGYVVVVPSMPAPLIAEDFEPLDYYSAQVESLALTLLESRMAVKGRLGFIGHSYGGFAALAVAARSKTISAVVASAPFADLISHHDVPFTWYDRLECAPNVARFHQGQMEYRTGPVLRMGSLPDLNLKKYLANSPRFQLSGRSPPTLLLQGQFDSAGFREADAVFMHLSRLGVPVREARYWGEGHNLANPANIRDAWQGIRNWFDEYLR